MPGRRDARSVSILLEPAVAQPSGWRFRRGVQTTSRAYRAPAFDDGLVSRPRLVRRLAGNPQARLAVLVAPAGYGKSTVLSEWAACDPRPFAWISLDDA